MGEILHAWALAPAAVGTCCVVADRGHPRAPELAASVLMLAAMFDASVSHLIAPVYWALVLIGAALALSAIRRSLRSTTSTPVSASGSGAMTVHTSLGMIAMATLLVVMDHGNAGNTDAVTTHHHLGSAGALVAVAVLGALAYGGVSLVVGVRSRGRFNRLQYLSMGASTAAMGLALVV